MDALQFILDYLQLIIGLGIGLISGLIGGLFLNRGTPDCGIIFTPGEPLLLYITIPQSNPWGPIIKYGMLAALIVGALIFYPYRPDFLKEIRLICVGTICIP